MDFLNIIKIAWNGLKVNKGRSFLTMLGIIIGVASVVIIISVGDGAQSLIYNQIQSLGSNLVSVLPGSGGDKGPPASALGIVITTLKYEDAIAMVEGPTAIPHISALTAYARDQATVSYEDKNINSPIYGIMASYPEVIDQKIEEGRFFNRNEEKNIAKVAVLGHKLKEDLFGEKNPVGKYIKIGNEKIQVIGYFEAKGLVSFQSLDIQVYMPISTAQKIIIGVKHVGLIRAKVDNDTHVDEVMENMRRTLRTRHHIKDPTDDDFTVASSKSALGAISTVTNVIKFVLAAVAAISLIVGGIGIMNIMLVVVNERTREIGLRKAIGAKARHILNQFLVEAIFITGCGGIIGILLGMMITAIIALIVQLLGYQWQLSFSTTAMIVGLGISSAIGIIFGYYPAKKAAHLNAIEALRYE